MSGILSGIGKVFTKVVGGLSTSLGSAVTGAGAAVATAGAASGGGLASGALSAAAGGLNIGSGGVLGNLLKGVAKVGGFLKDGVSSALGGMGAAVAPATEAATGGASILGRGGMLGKIGEFASTEAGAGLISGLGQGIASYAEAQMEQEEKQKDRQFLLDKEQRLRDSYEVPYSALPNGAPGPGAPVDKTPRPTPAQAYSRGSQYIYDAAAGRMVKVPA